MKIKWVIFLVAIVVVGFLTFKKFSSDKASVEKAVVGKLVGQSYWTCPMHPQIHADHAGECPICHMKLIQVKAQQTQQSQQEKNENRVPIAANPQQFKLIGVQKYNVEKMDLNVHIPVSGRFTSSSSVEFQMYESDLRFIKPGLLFKGTSSSYPEDEVTGQISSVDSIIDPSSRTVRVLGTVKGGPRVASETGFRGEIEISLKNRIAIPESAVLHTGSGDLVYAFTKDNELTPRVVKLGLKAETFFDVIKGLEAEEVISSGPNFLIDSEAKIRGAQ